MKLIILTALLFPLFSIAETQSEQFYKAVKFMLADSTRMRVEAYQKGDFATVCKATPSSAKYDTMTYYLSFETFDNAALKRRLYQDLSFYARSLESIYRSRLPQHLHAACWSNYNQKAKVSAVMAKILELYSQE